MNREKAIGTGLTVALVIIASQEFVLIPNWLMAGAWIYLIGVPAIRIFGMGWEEPPKLAATFTLLAMVMVPAFHVTPEALATAMFEHQKPWAEKLFLSRSSLGLLVIYLSVAYAREREFTGKLTKDHRRISALLAEANARSTSLPAAAPNQKQPD